ncbi:MAG: hypothetical protein OXR07_08375, partial [Nitrospira sp.]|nr:hypothetical protein [Nitrospira sp.]
RGWWVGGVGGACGEQQEQAQGGGRRGGAGGVALSRGARRARIGRRRTGVCHGGAGVQRRPASGCRGRGALGACLNRSTVASPK